MTANDTKRI